MGRRKAFHHILLCTFGILNKGNILPIEDRFKYLKTKQNKIPPEVVYTAHTSVYPGIFFSFYIDGSVPDTLYLLSQRSQVLKN